MSFAQDVAAALPEGLTLPTAFADTFDWIEAQGWTDLIPNRPADELSSRNLYIYPPEARNDPRASHVVFGFEAGPPVHAPPPEAIARISTIATIAGDGGTLSLWRDDTGKQWITVFNHGYPHVLTDDPVTALSFLAMGYPEPGALLDATQSPADHALSEGYDPPKPPHAFRTFIETHFAVTIPERAADLGITIPADGTPDPLRDWMDRVMPEPEIGEIPGMTAENPYIITRELREILGDEGISALRQAYEFVIEEE